MTARWRPPEGKPVGRQFIWSRRGETPRTCSTTSLSPTGAGRTFLRPKRPTSSTNRYMATKFGWEPALVQSPRSNGWRHHPGGGFRRFRTFAAFGVSERRSVSRQPRMRRMIGRNREDLVRSTPATVRSGIEPARLQRNLVPWYCWSARCGLFGRRNVRPAPVRRKTGRRTGLGVLSRDQMKLSPTGFPSGGRQRRDQRQAPETDRVARRNLRRNPAAQRVPHRWTGSPRERRGNPDSTWRGRHVLSHAGLFGEAEARMLRRAHVAAACQPSRKNGPQVSASRRPPCRNTSGSPVPRAEPDADVTRFMSIACTAIGTLPARSII